MAEGYRVRHDRIDHTGKVTLRYLSKLRHIPVGVANRNRKVCLLVAAQTFASSPLTAPSSGSSPPTPKGFISLSEAVGPSTMSCNRWPVWS